VVAATQPQAERWAQTNLARRGYLTYLPLLAVQRRDRATHRMMHTVHIPLFPGYLFMQLATSDPWTPIRYAPGVANLLMAAGRPEQVRPGLVEALQAGDSARRSIAPPAATWTPGAPCKLADGRFNGCEAVVIHAAPIGNIRVALLMFGALREIDVPAEWLEPRA